MSKVEYLGLNHYRSYFEVYSRCMFSVAIVLGIWDHNIGNFCGFSLLWCTSTLNQLKSGKPQLAA